MKKIGAIDVVTLLFEMSDSFLNLFLPVVLSKSNVISKQINWPFKIINVQYFNLYNVINLKLSICDEV